MSTTHLTSDGVAGMIRAAVKDRSYVTGTGIGPEVDRYLRWFLTEYGASEESAQSYEFTLARMALFHPAATLAQFEPPNGTELVRDFWSTMFQHCAITTRQNRLSHMASFFRWAVEQRKMVASPTQAIRSPKGRGRQRVAHGKSLVLHVMSCQLFDEDPIAIDLLGRHGLRRNELRLVQRRHVNFDTGELTVFGKGGTVIPIPLFPDLLERMTALALHRQWMPDEFLLYPRKYRKIDGIMQVLWEDRLSPLAKSSIDLWWRRCLQNAGVQHFPMHEMRHTAGTHFYRDTRDPALTRQLMRHKSSRTTFDVYVHMDQGDLAAAMRDLGRWDRP